LLHAYPDHHRFDGGELEIDNGWPVVCTEKDAIKLREIEGLADDVYYLEVGAQVVGGDGQPGGEKLATLLAAHGVPLHGVAAGS
jgi:tetraacyldisaccharide-1-P 4'-kinase